MGRLFWKFFLLAALAQVVTVAAIGVWISLQHERSQPDLRPPGVPGARVGQERLDQAAATLASGGAPALRERLDAWQRERGPQVLAIDADGRELLGRNVDRVPRTVGPPDIPSPPPDRPEASGPRSPGSGPPRAGPGSPPAGTGTPPPASGTPGARVVAADGTTWRLVLLHSGEPPRRRGPLPPVEPMVGGLLASLVIAALLARYVSRPVRSLRSAFDAVAQGRLDVRVGDAMGRRRDELSDLARDFDHTVVRLEALVDGQRRLLHTVSHELRSPLARLQAAVGLARQSGHADAPMDRIEREAERMDRLVDELLTLSRLEASAGVGRTEPVELAELVADVVADARYEVDAAKRPVRIECDLAQLDGVAVDGNPAMLHRAFDNVVRNATAHAGAPGVVSIAATASHDRREVVVTIADDGSGVPADELGSIFEPFFRSSNARDSQGHGLGLAITRRVVDAHGGRIDARNRDGGGLAIAIRLPVAG